ncbi:MAG: hypothetical protein JXR94_11580 [Candidatus Hydrogenedentes bacterium]|nr:hypothetical protein [Candidatus Hydrogenedentota bacterium]
MSANELSVETEYFEEIRQELLKTAPGKYAVIKGRECLGTFDSAENAYEEAAQQFGDKPFLIAHILPEDLIQEFPAYCLGLINARL